MSLDYTKIASNTFGALGSYAVTGGPGAAWVAGFAAGPVGAAVGLAIAGLGVAASLIGRGRDEADIIVPVQNQFGGILVSVNQTMDMDPNLTYEQLMGLAQIVADGYAKFDGFTRDPSFTDGRASVQARDTIRPLVDGRDSAGVVVRADGGTLGSIQRRIDSLGGRGTALASSGVLQAAGGKGILLAGAALLAKMLGWF